MTAGQDHATAVMRRHIEVSGIVQGVGFRPFVHRLATGLGLTGWVRNDGRGVTLQVQGLPAVLDTFVHRLRAEAPRLARVDTIDVTDCPAVTATEGFTILASASTARTTSIGPDTAVCDDCLAELFDPHDRRHRYAFINCTNCGPRYTITRNLPYDRAQTSMASFPLCPACHDEYRAPDDRRFHAEPNACPVCGPRLALLDAGGQAPAAIDPVAATIERIARGGIIAIKGVGGFHLACDARNPTAVARLREAKAREEKPFALMFANVPSIAAWADVSEAEAPLLASPERPIVLLRKNAQTDATFPGVAPGLAWLGAMLPSAPLHYLLFHEAAGRPPGSEWLARPQELALVMTSANPGGEPLVTGNDEALARLAGIADAFLVHDRDIVIRCDDSVVRMTAVAPQFGFTTKIAAGGATAADDEARRFERHADADRRLDEPTVIQFVRRARGYTPRAIRLCRSGPSILAVGGHFKNTVCITRGNDAFVSQHIGGLDNAASCVAFDEAIEHLAAILDVRPAFIAHDLHPDYHSTRRAAALAARWQVPMVAVQHHHAHVAAVVAEHRHEGPVLGLALDGTGLGTDGSAWGGELLRVDGARCQRLGHLAPLALPGGDRAAREPWRMAAAALARCGRSVGIGVRFADEPAAATVAAMLERRLHSPETSSLGRWFDAAAGLLGVSRRMAFEGQAAMLLEGLAERHGPVAAAPGLFQIDDANVLDFTALALALADTRDRDRGHGAALFHATVAAGLVEWASRAAAASGTTVIAGGGGCFLNAILAREVRAGLAARGLTLLEASAVPPNDGGLALGQAWVARCAMGERAESPRGN